MATKAHRHSDARAQTKQFKNNLKTQKIMHTWFECKIKYKKTADEGKIVKVAESYLVDALSFTEAEALINRIETHEQCNQ